MNVFILGLPHSGKTTVARALEKSLGLKYINASDWTKHFFREQQSGEHEQHFKEEYQKHLLSMFADNPNMCTTAIQVAKNLSNSDHHVIEGIVFPKDFINTIDFKNDIVVFLNRTDNSEYFHDQDNIALPLMRDYCFWLSSAGFLTKSRWLEYNFKIPGEDSEHVKILGSKNTVYLVKSISKAITHLTAKLEEAIK